MVATSLPSAIWDPSNPWIPPAEAGPTYEMNNFASSVRSAATRGLQRIPKLRIEGNSLDELANQLSNLIDEAGKNSNYSVILLPDRHFIL